MISRVRQYLARDGLGPLLLKALIGSAGLRVIGMGFGFLVGVQLARGLGAEGYGTYGLAMSIIALLMVPTEFGLPQLVVRETAASAAKGDWGKVRGLLRWSRSISLRGFILVAVVVVLVLIVGMQHIDHVLAMTLLVGLATIPLVALGKTRAAALRGLRHIVKGQMPDTLLRPGTQSMLLFAVAALTIPLTPVIAMLLGVVGAVVGLVVSTLMLRRAFPPEAELVEPKVMADEWRSSCMPMAMTEAMRILQGHLVLLMLGFMATVTSVGIYKIATAINLIVMMPTGIFISVVAPLISSLFASGDRSRLQRLLSWTSGGMVVSTAILSAPFFFAAPFAIRMVFGDEFVGAAVPLQILCAGALLTATAGTAGTLLNMTGHEMNVRRASFQALLLLVILLPPLIWRAGTVGAAIATVLASLLWRMRMVHDCRKLLGLEPGFLHFFKSGGR